MKKILFICFVFVLFIQCQIPKNKTTPIVFTINQFDVHNNQMEVSFSITNPTEHIWKGGAWSLHWNSIFGETIPESLPQGMKYTYVSGQQYLILEFGEQYSLKPNENLSFTVKQKGIIPRVALGPQGFFVHDAKTQNNIDLQSRIDWENAKGIELLSIPSAADRYAEYNGLKLLPKTELEWVIPKPLKQTFNGVFRTTSDLNLNLGDFEMDFDFIQQRLQEGLNIKVNIEKETLPNVLLRRNNMLTQEAYTLSISEENIQIEASEPIGAYYAFESLHQILLIAQNEEKGWPLLSIEDAPRFRNRGFMSDVVRNFYSKKKIFQILDYMALYKLNRFDLKLTDDDGWRIEIPDLPELTEVGSKRGYTVDESDRLIPMYGSGSGDQESKGSGYLSSQDFVDILKYAEQRYIEVIPQISFPSHARAAIMAMKARYNKYKSQGNLVAASEYMLHDPDDKSEYISAQLYRDNVVCICDPSAYRFYEKVIKEIKALYDKAEIPMKVFNIGADELPYGPWRKSPKCENYITQNKAIASIDDLYNYNLSFINEIITKKGARMVGWEDALLIHSENEQSEITINEALLNLDFTPYVWNNSWGGGREDMTYRLANKGFQVIMSNSSAFYFDMVDDYDFENYGMSWSGFVNYKDSWGTEPLNVFANTVKLESLGIDLDYVMGKEKIKPEAITNFLGIQSQLWTETIITEELFDQLFMPNLIVFAQRAWGAKESWLKLETATEQKPLLEKSWNVFANTIGQRQLLMISQLYGGLAYDLPKPGAIIDRGQLKVRQQFPGLSIHYTLNGKEPNISDLLFSGPIKLSPSDQIIIRVFDPNGRGGNSIRIKK